MKTLFLPQSGKMEICETKKPELSEGCAVIKVKACGICGSDLTAYRGTNPTVKYPVEGIGHEGVGIIAEIGKNDKGLNVGDRVALEPYIPCNQCHSCKEERFNNCVNLKVAGVHTTGMMSEYYSHPISLIHKLPDTLDFDRAALIEPLTIGLHGVARAKVKKGEYCLITGAGPIGILAAFGALSYRATPILMDILEERLVYAKSLGITCVYNNTDNGIIDYLKEITNGKMPESMIECTGSPVILGAMHEYVCHGARISMVGWPKSPVSINIIRCMQKELDLHPSRNSNNKFPEAISLINSEQIPVEKMITKKIYLSETEEVIKDMIANSHKYVKVIVEI